MRDAGGVDDEASVVLRARANQRTMEQSVRDFLCVSSRKYHRGPKIFFFTPHPPCLYMERKAKTRGSIV